MADGGLLALLACLGGTAHTHETTSHLVQLCCTTLVSFGPHWATVQDAGSHGTGRRHVAGLVLSGAPTLALLYALAPPP